MIQGRVAVRKLVASSFIAIVMAGLAGCNRQESAPPARYLALGDSYTSGHSVGADERWPVQLADLLREQGVDVGQPQIIARTGWTTRELATAIDANQPQGPYQLVTLLIGVNNQYQGRDVAEFRTDFRALLGRAIGFAGDRPSRVIVVSIPDYGVTPFAGSQNRDRIAREIDAFNDICRDESARAKVAFVDITPESKKAATQPALIAGDGLHPSGRMYEQWARQILPKAKRALSQ